MFKKTIQSYTNCEKKSKAQTLLLEQVGWIGVPKQKFSLPDYLFNFRLNNK